LQNATSGLTKLKVSGFASVECGLRRILLPLPHRFSCHSIVAIWGTALRLRLPWPWQRDCSSYHHSFSSISMYLPSTFASSCLFFKLSVEVLLLRGSGCWDASLVLSFLSRSVNWPLHCLPISPVWVFVSGSEEEMGGRVGWGA
jgi:hypothetical protein